MLLKTGFGYLKDKNGKIVSKFILNSGSYEFSKEYTVVEVNSYEELNNIQVEKHIDINKKSQKEIMLEILGLTEQDLIKIKALK